MECWSTPLQWLCEFAGYWQELEHAVVYAKLEHPKHAQWVTCPVSRDGYNNGPQDLVTVSLCIQNAINVHYILHCHFADAFIQSDLQLGNT